MEKQFNPIVNLKKQIKDIIIDYKNWLLNNKEEKYNKIISINGWVRDFRQQTENAFISLHDGSTCEILQIICSNSVFNNFSELENMRGACIQVTGNVVKSPAKGQLIELVASDIKVLGDVQDKKSILLAKNVQLDTLRSYQHLRPRFRTFGYIYKIRSTLLKNIHNFFHANNFITPSCQGVSIRQRNVAGRAWVC
jgi:asparaginyl-tRNA synthetase